MMNMSDNKISVDLDKLYKERGAKQDKKKPMSIDELREVDQEQTILESLRNKGKMSMVEYMMYMDMMDRRRSNSGSTDIEKAIERATAPLQEEIRMMREKERQREEEERWNRRFEEINGQMAELRMAIASGNTDAKDPLIDKLDAMQKKIEDMNEDKSKKEREAYENSLKQQLEGMNRAIADIRHDPNANKSDLERLEELEAMRQRYQKVLGIKSQDDEASTSDMIATGLDMFTEKVPGIVKTVNTIKDGFSSKGEDDIPDDVPPGDIPANVPARKQPTANRSAIPPDIKEFLAKGKEKNGGFVDYSGVPWTDSITNSPLSRSDIEIAAITDPDMVRDMIRQCNEDYEKQKKNDKGDAPAPIPEDDYDDNPDDAPVPQENSKPAEKEEIPEETDEGERAIALAKAFKYIRSGNEVDKDGKKVFVGPNGETFEAEAGEMSMDDMESEARIDPEGFLKNIGTAVENGNKTEAKKD